MLKLSDLLIKIERRAKCLRGFQFAGLALILSSVLLSVIVSFDFFDVLKVDRFVLILTLLFPLICCLVAYIMGKAKRPNLSQILLKIDLALGTDERLSSLLEIHRSGGGRPFRRLIENKLQRQSFNWKRGLPLRPSTVFINGLGIFIFLGLATLIGFQPYPSLITNVREATSSGVTTPERKGQITAPSKLQIKSDKVAPSKEAVSSPDGEKTEKYDNSLAKIRGQPSTEGILSNQNKDLSQLIERQRNLTRQLSELLSELKKRMQEGKDNSALTKKERELLGNLRSQVRHQKLRQTLGKMLKEKDPEKIKELTEQALEMTENPPEGEGQNKGDEKDRFKARSKKSPDKETDESLTSQPTMPNETSQPEAGRPDGLPEKEGESDLTEESPQASLKDESRFGGKEGASGKNESVDRNQGFVPQDLMGVIGEEGGFEEFVTKGVPVEPKAGQKGESSSFTVNYEVLRAILKERNVPSPVRELIRNYFRSIAEGES